MIRALVGDPAAPLVVTGDAAGAGAGRSPTSRRGTAVGDELKNAGWPSRVLSIAVEDRAAVLLGGRRADLARWFHGGAFGGCRAATTCPTASCRPGSGR